MEMEPKDAWPERKTERLHVGRVSASECRYFITWITEGRKRWLGEASAMEAVLGALKTWHAEGDGRVFAACVMLDHVHVLVELGKRLSVGRLVSRWKTQARRACGYRGEWQRDFWEHRLRAEENFEDYGLYVLLNPYRAGLAGADAAWPGWWCPEPKTFLFSAAMPRDGVPMREWIGWGAGRFADLKIGE